MTDNENQPLSIQGAVANTAQFFQEIEEQFGVPPAVTMDILRFHMLYTVQQAQPQQPEEEQPNE